MDKIYRKNLCFRYWKMENHTLAPNRQWGALYECLCDKVMQHCKDWIARMGWGGTAVTVKEPGVVCEQVLLLFIPETIEKSNVPCFMLDNHIVKFPEPGKLVFFDALKIFILFRI